MSSQPRAPTKQIQPNIVDPRRPVTGTMTGSNETPTPGGRCCPAGVWRSGRRNHVSANGCSRAQAEDCVTDLVDQLPVGLPDPGVAGQLSPRRQGRLRCPGCQLEPPPVPWPSPLDLGFQREAQHDPDQHDHPQYPDALERRVDDDCPNDVGDYQHFEAEQDHPSKVRAQLLIRVGCVRDNLLRVAGESEETAEDHDCCSNALDDLHDLADETFVAHPPTLAMDTTAGNESLSAWSLSAVGSSL